MTPLALFGSYDEYKNGYQDDTSALTTTPSATPVERGYDATLTKREGLRKCDSLTCDVLRYYGDTEVVRVIGQDTLGEWYTIKAKDEDGKIIYGWMPRSALAPFPVK